MAKLADEEIIPAVLAKIEHCEGKITYWAGYNVRFPGPNSAQITEISHRFAKAADRLRDFAAR